MKIKIIFFTLFCLFTGLRSFGQTYQEGERDRVGLKAGPALTTLKGNALATPSFKYGFTGGIYYKYKLKGGFHFQTEILAASRGARFKSTGPNGYTKFELLYIDGVELIMKDLKKGDHTHCAVIGLQPSIMVQSSVYDKIYQLSPSARGIALNRGELFIVFGYQFNKRIIGIQSLIKIGLTNINRGLNMYSGNDGDTHPVLPPTNNSGNIRNISWETSIAF